MSNATVKSLPKFDGFGLKRPRLLPLFVYLAVLVGVSLFFVWSRVAVVNLEYEISSLDNRLREAEEENRSLQVEVAHLQNPDRIEMVARESLGMINPTPDQVTIVD